MTSSISFYRNTNSIWHHQNDLLSDRYNKLIKAISKNRSKVDIIRAVDFAASKYSSQNINTEYNSPYIIHSIGVALLLMEEIQIHDRDTIIAALLHDLLKKTDTTEMEIHERFRGAVATIISEITNPKEVEVKAWQIEHAPSRSQSAKLILLANHLYTIRNVNPAHIELDMDIMKDNCEWGQRLLDVLKGTNGKLERLFQEEINKYTYSF